MQLSLLNKLPGFATIRFASLFLHSLFPPFTLVSRVLAVILACWKQSLMVNAQPMMERFNACGRSSTVSTHVMDTVARARGGVKASLGLHYVVPTWGRLQVGEAPGGAGSGAVMSPGGQGV